ncbi:bifunctional riboflavin kinase/FAD synthetase [Cyanobium gracile UHCC 0139]|uniref:Riboflavin biosynthesis protein n=1 Tax=Cyanobium gracile UHCC 0139 TaxID=3110308 RepID=A0ABU5RUZ9_9CYAN|nr:bifunctional riboflavin kinase/FAD synthetase [Cyanobium gracile]MEA5391591.1 bifunctional riboflavin kinase/FAD synthetase [Cyanobium gracile UHCC 0139]
MIPLHDPPSAQRPTAVALGSFDGLHRGHRRVIAAVTAPMPVALGRVVPTVVSFWPHPREVLHGETRLRLDLPEEKLELLEPLGIAQLVLVPFTRELAALTPEPFVRQVLAERLQARRIAVGTNFRFGVDRRGDVDDLARIGASLGIDVQVVPMLWDGAERVSSSRIRRALAAGDIDEAARLLERPYRFSGQVVSGRGLGRQLGWPTANLAVDGRKFLPQEGVYAALAWREGEGGEGPMAAVMNLGPQPTVDPLAPSAVEVHLLERRLELAGARLTVQPLRLLRRQQTFASLEALSRQIQLDADLALQACRSAGGDIQLRADG